MKYTFNLNHSLKVKLSEKGYEHLVEKAKNIFEDLSEKTKTRLEVEKYNVDYYKSLADKDGYTEFQLHEFIENFGDVIGVGKPTHKYLKDFNLVINSNQLKGYKN